MKLASKILLVIAMILIIPLMVQVMGIHGGRVRWRHVREVEEAAIPRDHMAFTQAHDHYLAKAAEFREIAKGKDAFRLEGLLRERNVLQLYEQEAKAASEQVKKQYDSLDAAIRTVTGTTPKRYQDVIKALRAAVENRTGNKRAIHEDIANHLESVANQRAEYAVNYEDYLILEYNQYLLQEDLQRQKEIMFRYRWLRPDLQSEVGDTGKFISGRVVAATDYSVIIDKGSRDGIELYQKFTVMHGGRVVAIVDVTEVRNDNCEAEIRSLPYRSEGLKPEAGDTVQPQRFIAGVGRPDLERRLPSR